MQPYSVPSIPKFRNPPMTVFVFRLATCPTIFCLFPLIFLPVSPAPISVRQKRNQLLLVLLLLSFPSSARLTIRIQWNGRYALCKGF